MDDDYKVNPLFIMLSKISAYVKGYGDKTKWMNFLIKDDELLKKYNDIWNKVCNSIKKNFISNPFTIKKSENQNKVLQ